MKTLSQVLVLIGCSFYACQPAPAVENKKPLKSSIEWTESKSLIEEAGTTIKERFKAPEGFTRAKPEASSFEYYLQNLPLKSFDQKVQYYDGQVKHKPGVYISVVDMELDARNLQQCADAIIRLRGEYLYAQERYDDILFHFTNGFEAPYSKWRKGHRIKVEGRNVNWYATGKVANTYQVFRQYMRMIFAYAGTISLSQELNPKSLEDISIGDVFIQGGSPGHAVIVVDVAIKEETGERQFLLAQSYMPAQDIQILQNPFNTKENPWYSNQNLDKLITPEWTFKLSDLKSF